MHEEHTHVDRQKIIEQNTHPWTRNMDEHHTSGTVISFVFWRIYWNFSWYDSLFIVYIGINMISCIYLCYLHCSFSMYLCLTGIILVLCSLVVPCYVCVYIYMHTHLFSIYSCLLFCFCLLSIFDYLLSDYCHVYFIIWFVLFSSYMNMYVGIHMCLFRIHLFTSILFCLYWPVLV